MDDTDRNHEDDAESTPFELAPMEPDEGPDGTNEEIVPEDAEPDEKEFQENDDFEIGITIEAMRGEEPMAATDRSDGMEEPEDDAVGDAAPSDFTDLPDSLEAQVPDSGADGHAEPADSSRAAGTDPILTAITGLNKTIGERIEQLADLFETKIKVDTHKNKVIDNLHGELQTFRDGIIKKQFYSFVTDMIKVIDDVRKFKRHYDGMPPTAENMDSILNFLEGITSDIEDLFSWQGVIPFCCEEGILDTSRQRVIKKIECDDPAMDRMVAESMRPGYEWDGKIIRPEMVSIYMYVNNNLQEDTLADGQTD